jgi:hypothetical protein
MFKRQTIMAFACTAVAAAQGNYYGAFKKDALTIFQAIRAELGELVLACELLQSACPAAAMYKLVL